MTNNSEAKRDQNGPIHKKTWGFQTITGEVLVKGSESGKRMSRLECFANAFFFATNTMYFASKYCVQEK